MFAAIGRFSYRFRWPVLILWVAAFIAGIVATTKLPAALKGGGFTNREAPAQRALELQHDRLKRGLASVSVVFTHPSLRADSQAFQRMQMRALAPLTPESIPNLQAVQTYASSGDERLIADDGSASLAVLVFDVPLERVQPQVDELRRLLGKTALNAYVTGEPAVYEDLERLSAEDLQRAETYALPLALAILLLVFGSVVAAALPVIGGAMAVTITLGAAYLVAQVLDLSIFVMNTASMLGLAVGIDYALFVVARFREELTRRASVAEAVEATVSRAGRAIFYSGVAVVIGLLGLMSFEYMSLRSIGIGGSIVVLLSVGSALTLLPALLGMLGHRVDALRILPSRGTGGGFWRRWSDLVMAHPWPALIAAMAIIAAFTLPLLHIRVNVPTASSLPPDAEARIGYDILQTRFDRGALSPISVLVTFEGDPFAPRTLDSLYAYGRRLERLPGAGPVTSIVTLRGLESAAGARRFWAAAKPGGNAGPSPPDGGPSQEQIQAARGLAAATTAPGAVLFTVPPKADPTSAQAQSLATGIRELEPPAGLTAHVAGLSAGVHDFLTAIYGRFPWVILYIFVVTGLVMFALLRSALLPLKAVLVNGLSILSSYGALVFVFQDGHLEGLLGFQSTGTVDATLPVLMFCTVFGVSMDYEVFLLTRMREEWIRTGDNRLAVGFGLATTGRVITSAALIIVIVAGSFALTSVLITKAIGVGLAVAIALDATIVRVLLVPATMRVLGRINWWQPRWSRRLLREP